MLRGNNGWDFDMLLTVILFNGKLCFSNILWIFESYLIFKTFSNSCGLIFGRMYRQILSGRMFKIIYFVASKLYTKKRRRNAVRTLKSNQPKWIFFFKKFFDTHCIVVQWISIEIDKFPFREIHYFLVFHTFSLFKLESLLFDFRTLTWVHNRGIPLASRFKMSTFTE